MAFVNIQTAVPVRRQAARPDVSSAYGHARAADGFGYSLHPPLVATGPGHRGFNYHNSQSPRFVEDRGPAAGRNRERGQLPGQGSPKPESIASAGPRVP